MSLLRVAGLKSNILTSKPLAVINKSVRCYVVSSDFTAFFTQLNQLYLQWPCNSLQEDKAMGNTSSERAAMGHGEKAQRRDSRGIKEGERPKILMDSPEDADIFHGEDIKVNWAALLEVHIR